MRTSFIFYMMAHFITELETFMHDLGNLGLIDYFIALLFQSEFLLPKATTSRVKQAVYRFIVSSRRF